MMARTPSLSPRDKDADKRNDSRRLSSGSASDFMKDVDDMGITTNTPKPRTLQEETARAVALSTLKIHSTSTDCTQEEEGEVSPPPTTSSPRPAKKRSSGSAKRRARKSLLESSMETQRTPPPPPPLPPTIGNGPSIHRYCLVHKQHRLIQHCVGHGNPPKQYTCKPEFPCIPTRDMRAPRWQTQHHSANARERQTSAPPPTTRTTSLFPEGKPTCPRGSVAPLLSTEPKRRETFSYTLYDAIDEVAKKEADSISLRHPSPQLRCLLPGAIAAMLTTSGKDLQDNTDMVATRITMALSAAIKTYIDKEIEEKDEVTEGRRTESSIVRNGMEVTMTVRPKTDEALPDGEHGKTVTEASYTSSDEERAGRTDSEDSHGYRSCLVCKCFEPFQYVSAESCCREKKARCIFPAGIPAAKVLHFDPLTGGAIEVKNEAACKTTTANCHAPHAALRVRSLYAKHRGVICLCMLKQWRCQKDVHMEEILEDRGPDLSLPVLSEELLHDRCD